MKKIWIIRCVLAAAFLVCAVLCFVLGEEKTPAALAATRRLQIVPMYLAEGAGVIAVWLLITLVWGRIYCSTVCPVGTLQDVMLHVRRRIPALNRPFRYTRPQRMRHHVLIVYVACLVLGLGVIPLVLEPWFMTGNMVQAAGLHGHGLWAKCGYSALWGVIWGAVSLAILLPWALLRGREFCNTVCPLGTVMGYLSRRSAFQIVIDGDRCTSCMRCQDNCRASCIKVVSRYVDNSRCVRCLECVAKCPEQAIRYTQDRQRPATPLFTRIRRSPGA
jgi:hypothetical protein